MKHFPFSVGCLIILMFIMSTAQAVGTVLPSGWFSLSKVKENALLAGYDATNKRTLYVCGSYLWGSFQIGLNYNNASSCHIPYKERTYTVDTFYLLRALNGRWQNVGRKLPKNTVYLGVGLKKAPLALCRSFLDGSLIPGKTWPGLNGCQLTYLGRVSVVKEYAVFVHRHLR